MPHIRTLMIGLAMTIACTTPAAAQITREPRLAVAFGVGRVDPVPIDLPYTARTWSAAIQITAAKHLIIEGAVGGWRHTATDDFEQFGRVGSPELVLLYRAKSELHDSKTLVSVSAIAAATIGRLRLRSGAGVGRAVFATDYSETITECAVAQACRSGPPYRSSIGLFSMQGVLGLDVAVAHQLRASLTYRLSQPFTAALGDNSVLAGLTFGLR